jgi:F-type H+-transporting ATPase subunit b
MAAESDVFTSLGINPLILIGQVINFLILLFLLNKFLYKPILKKLDERSKLIKAGLKAAEENLKRQEEIDSLKEKELKKARELAEEFLTKAKENAEQLKLETISKTKAEVEKLNAKQEAERKNALAKERKELKEEVVNLSSEIARQVLQQFIDDKMQNNIIESQLKKLASEKNK